MGLDKREESNCDAVATIASANSEGALKLEYPFRDVSSGGNGIEILHPCNDQSLDVVYL